MNSLYYVEICTFYFFVQLHFLVSSCICFVLFFFQINPQGITEVLDCHMYHERGQSIITSEVTQCKGMEVVTPGSPSVVVCSKNY